MYNPPTLDILIEDMKSCEQTTGQTIWEHGYSVLSFFTDWNDGDYEKEWKLPEWECQIDPNELYGMDDIAEYIVFHDCGKPYCKTVEDGQYHFYNHANVSADIYLSLSGNQIASKLIREDMVLHTATSEEIEQKLKNEWSKRDALTLLIVALCEIHSNASMFGGIDSTSFKIKWKKLNSRGKQILKWYHSG